MTECVCGWCGEAFQAARADAAWCSDECRRLGKNRRRRAAGYAPLTPCDRCGAQLHHTSRLAVDGRRYCLTCRTENRQRPKVACETCGEAFQRAWPGRYCSRACYQQSRMVHPDRNAARRAVYAKRAALIKAAGGLTKHDMTKLLQRWKRQGRRCTYCPAVCETVEHVIPLIRGGTNFEGNLAPACRRCNRRKGARLVAEWRYSNRRTFKVSLCVTG